MNPGSTAFDSQLAYPQEYKNYSIKGKMKVNASEREVVYNIDGTTGTRRKISGNINGLHALNLK